MLDINSMTYMEFISLFEVYPSQKEAQAKGFEAHHINAIALQVKEYDKIHNTNYSTMRNGREVFTKEIGVPDDRCVRLLPSEHAYAHYLWDKEHPGFITFRIFANALGIKDGDEVTYEKCLPYNDLVKVTEEKAREGIKTFNADEEKVTARNKKISNALQGIPHTEEHKKKIGEGTKAHYSDPETRLTLSEATKIGMDDPEVKQARQQCKYEYYHNNPNNLTWNEFQREYYNN